MSHYIALIHKEPKSGYGVSFPDLPGIIAVADTLDEALHEGAVALGFAFEDWHGGRPVLRTLDEFRRDFEFLEQSSDAVVAAIAPAGAIAPRSAVTPVAMQTGVYRQIAKYRRKLNCWPIDLDCRSIV